MEKQTLHFEETLVDGITYAVMNFFQLVCCLILYLLTIWVPYVNIGTTIAMSYLRVKIAKEEAISPTHIFNAGYRKHMSHFFILCGIMLISFIPALCFFVVPAIVLYWAWSLSFYFLLEKGKSPNRGAQSFVRCHRWQQMVHFQNIYGNRYCFFHCILHCQQAHLRVCSILDIHHFEHSNCLVSCDHIIRTCRFDMEATER